MALTIAIEGTGELTNAESTTNWNKSGLISAPQQETDLVLQGTYAVSSKASGKSGWLYWDEYTAAGSTALDFSSSGAQYEELVYIWWNCTTIGALNTKASSGLAIQMGTDASNYRTWILGGSDDFGNNYSGGWQCAVIDPTKTGSVSDTGTYSISDIRLIGLYIDATGSSKSENLIIDTIAVGKGLRITGTDATGWQEVSDYCRDFPNRAWGMFQERQGIYYVYGTLYVGDTAQTAVTSLTDSARVLRFGDYEYWDSSGSAWVAAIPDGFNGITVEDASSYSTTFEDGVVVGTDQGRSGSVLIGSEECNTTFDLYGGNEATSVTKIYGSVLRGIDGDITFGEDVDHQVQSTTFEECGVVAVNLAKFRNCRFIKPEDDAITVDTTSWNVADCIFVEPTGHGIEFSGLSADATLEFDNLVFSGTSFDSLDGYDVENATVYDIIIENINGSNASNYENTSTGSTTIVDKVTLEVHVEDTDGNDIQDAQVYIQKETPTIYTIGSGNEVGDGDFVVNESIDSDLPQTGWIIVWAEAINKIQPYRYASWSGSTFTFNDEVTGTAGSDGSGTTLKRGTGESFLTADIEEGDTIRNTSDGSWAVVDEIVDADTITTSQLTGGNLNTWYNGHGYSLHTLPVSFEADNWDILSALNSGKYKYVIEQGGVNPFGVFFKPDGTKMYVSNYSDKVVYQYSLSVAWDVDTASYDNKYADVSNEDNAFDIFFKPDGTKMYIMGGFGGTDTVYQYTLSTPWDVSTASYDTGKYKDVSTEENQPFGLFFKPDGTKMYIVGTSNGTVYQYTLSSAWDVSTASYDTGKYKDVSTEENQPRGLFFKPDGTKMYISGYFSGEIHQYTLSTAWDVSTASYDTGKSYDTNETLVQSLYIKSDFSAFYITDNSDELVLQFTLVDGGSIDAPIMNMQTDSNGNVSKDYTGTTPMSIVVRIRTASGATKYINYNTAGTIVANTGYYLIAILQEDTVA